MRAILFLWYVDGDSDFDFSSPIVGTTSEISATSSEMSQMIHTLYHLHAIQPSISAPPDLYRKHSIVIEDALGYSLRIPLETIRSWTVCTPHEIMRPLF